MKTISWKLAMCIVMMLGVFTFSSCSDGENEDDVIIEYADLFGIWKLVFIDMEETRDGELYDSQKGEIADEDAMFAEFKKGGVYVGTTDEGSGTGKWSYKNGKITISVLDPETGEEDVETGTVQKLTNAELVLEVFSEITEDGSLYEYHAIQSYVKVK